ncbi:MAG: putative toxin-antitoxin system toxin component, PIN family [Candidatus Aenigmatarchaeota archaeon]
MRFVFDTNVLLSSTLWYNSVSKKLLNKIIACDHELFSSAPIISEYQNVLRRDFEFSSEEIKRITNVVFSSINLVESKEKLYIVKEDPDDDKILECAMASSADFIITYDKHLLRLKEFGKIRIIAPEEAIKII